MNCEDGRLLQRDDEEMEAPAPDDIDRVLDAVQSSLARPLTTLERQTLRVDLERSLEIRNLFSGLETHELRGSRSSKSPTSLIEQIRKHLARQQPGEIRLTVTPPKSKSMTARSFTGLWYLQEIASKYASFWPRLEREVWQNDDVEAMDRLYHRAIEHEHFVRFYGVEAKNTVLLELLFLLAELVYHSPDPRFVGLREGLVRLDVNWRRAIQDGVATLTPDTVSGVREETLQALVQHLEQILIQEDERQNGRGTRRFRRLTDEFETRQGVLTAACAAWTYEELEFWAKVALQTATPQQICGWLLTRSEIDVEGFCDELPRSELESKTVELLALVPKSGLCSFLVEAQASPPPILRWSDQRHHNVEVREGYLDDPEARSRLDVLGEGEGEFDYDEDEKRLVWTKEFKISDGHGIGGFPLAGAGLRGMIASDLWQKLFSHRHSIKTQVVELSASTPPLVLAVRYVRGAKTDYAVLILKGDVVASPVSTQQEMDWEGNRVIETDLGPLLTPERIALAAGDVLALRKSLPSAEGENHIYDQVILRASEVAHVAVVKFR